MDKSELASNVFDLCRKAYEEDPRPVRLGHMFCYWYNDKNEPRIVIGPHWPLSLVKIALVNGVMAKIFEMLNQKDESWLFVGIGYLLLLSENVAFLWTMCKNPGLARRDPSIHSKRYLNIVRDVEKAPGFKRRICEKCKVIYEEKAKMEHCKMCGFCM